MGSSWPPQSKGLTELHSWACLQFLNTLLDPRTQALALHPEPLAKAGILDWLWGTPTHPNSSSLSEPKRLLPSSHRLPPRASVAQSCSHHCLLPRLLAGPPGSSPGVSASLPLPPCPSSFPCHITPVPTHSPVLMLPPRHLLPPPHPPPFKVQPECHFLAEDF